MITSTTVIAAPELAEALVHILYGLFAFVPAGRPIDIDIRPFPALFAEEALEEKVVPTGSTAVTSSA